MSGKITGELRAYGDTIASSLALPGSGSVSTSAFTNAGILSDTEIVLEAAASISITSGKALSFELMECDTENGTFTKAADIVSFTGAKTIDSGAEIARFVPNSRVKHFMKIRMTDDEDLSAGKVTVYPVRKG